MKPCVQSILMETLPEDLCSHSCPSPCVHQGRTTCWTSRSTPTSTASVPSSSWPRASTFCSRRSSQNTTRRRPSTHSFRSGFRGHRGQQMSVTFAALQCVANHRCLVDILCTLCKMFLVAIKCSM